jgi:hypothetical protein
MFYFFRDLTHEGNHGNGTTYHAAGLVEKIYNTKEDTDKNKDMSVLYLEPFDGTVTCAWRAHFEVELFEVDSHRYYQLISVLETFK